MRKQTVAELAIGPQPAARPAAWRRADLGAMVLLVLIWAAMAAIIRPIGNFPMDDDWVYALAVRSILETGHFALPGPAAANLLAQAYWGALFCLPFGFSFTALRVATLVLGCVGPVALYLLVLELSGRRLAALIGALSLMMNPLYLVVSASFMTDAPFTSLITAALWLYVRGARRNSGWSIGIAFVLAFAAISIRQFALVLPLAFGVAHLARKGLSIRALAIAVLPFILAIGLQIMFDHWRAAAAGALHYHVPALGNLLSGSPLGFVRPAAAATLKMVPYAGLFAAPFVTYLACARSGDKAMAPRSPSYWPMTILLSVALTVLLVTLRSVLPALGDILTTTGLGPLTLRDTWLLHLNQPDLPPIAIATWLLVTAFSCWASTVAVPAVVAVVKGLSQGWRHHEIIRAAWPQLLMLALIVFYVGGLLLVSASGPVFDRYLLPLVPPMFAILSMGYSNSPAEEPAWRWLPSVAVLVAYAMFSVLATHDYLAWNRTRWQATDSLLRAGVTPHQIDGGYEFDGWYLYKPGYRATPARSYWWVDRDDYLIASGPIDGYREIRRFPVHRWLGLGEPAVLILRRYSALAPPISNPSIPAVTFT